jgi:nucleotide-binding universal stress UspA family protein
MKHRILVGLDGSPMAETVLPFAALLARRLPAEMVLVHVTPMPDVGVRAALDEIADADRRRAEAYLRERAAELAGIETSILVVLGDPASELVRTARLEEASLIALATHGRSGLGRWTHGSVADRVLHGTTTPLLLVRPDEAWTPAPREIRQVLVALDGSRTAEAALPLARSIARVFEAPITLLRAAEPMFYDFELGDAGQILDAVEEGARRYLDGVAARERRHGVSVHPVVRVGFAAETLAQWVAEHPGTLLVLTTHARAGLGVALLGSVARRVTQIVRAPLVVVPPAHGA